MWYKNIKAQNVLILVLALSGIAGSVYVFNLSTQLSPDEEREIESRVLTVLVDYLTHHAKVDTDLFFIGISGSDPSSELLNSFADHDPAVKPISLSMKTFGFTAPVVLKTDLSKRGMQIDLHILERKPNGNVDVLVTIYQDRASSARYEFTLDRFDGAYRIISSKYPESSDF